jgi:RNA polymerase-binding transcription factor DksA
VERQKEVLQRELRSLEEQIETLEEALKVKPNYGMGQGDPAVTQWELDQAMLERLRSHVDELEQALDRLDEGTYGVCERCGKRINPNRLAVLPDTKICVSCAQKGNN